MRFGAMLRELRTRRRKTLRWVAGMAGLSPSYISRVEQGHMPPPPAAVRLTIYKTMGFNHTEIKRCEMSAHDQRCKLCDGLRGDG